MWTNLWHTAGAQVGLPSWETELGAWARMVLPVVLALALTSVGLPEKDGGAWIHYR